jgi:hypothetical protein
MVRHSHPDISLPGEDTHDVRVELTISSADNEDIADKVMIHAKDEIVRAMQAFEEGEHPNNCDGTGIHVAWYRVLEDVEDGDAR